MKKIVSCLAISAALCVGIPTLAAPTAPVKSASAIFAGGCFWCVEADFEKLPGVLSAESGYTGGKSANPTYNEVSSGATGHAEAVRVVYDPAIVSYAALLDYFWHHIDPTVKDRQFCDTGNHYRSAIYYNNGEQRALIEQTKAGFLKSGKLKEIHTEIAPAGQFYPAEDYHQDYYKKNPIRYRYYRNGCGRDSRVAEVWGTSH